MEDERDDERDGSDEPTRPPGQFMSDELAADTARFLAEVKRLAERRAAAEDDRSRL